MPYTPNSTWVDGSGGGTPISAARLNNLESGVTATYDTYTPTWTASGSAPSIGNATVVARYMQRGKHVHAYGRHHVREHIELRDRQLHVRAARLSGAGSRSVMVGRDLRVSTRAPTTSISPAQGIQRGSTSLMMGLYGSSVVGAIAVYGQTVPWSWANGDVLEWNIVYEAA